MMRKIDHRGGGIRSNVCSVCCSWPQSRKENEHPQPHPALHIEPAGDYGWAMARLYDERAAHEQQLAQTISAPLKLSQPRMLTIEYSDGVQVKIAIKEMQP